MWQRSRYRLHAHKSIQQSQFGRLSVMVRLYSAFWLICLFPAVRSCCNRINENNTYASTLSLASSSRDTLIPTSSRCSSTSGSVSTSSSSSSSSSTSTSSAVAPPSYVASRTGKAASIVSGTSSSSVISSIDSELLDIQTRLVFPKNMPVSRINLTGSAHVVWVGALQTEIFQLLSRNKKNNILSYFSRILRRWCRDVSCDSRSFST